MSSTNRAEKFKSLFKLLQKTIKHAPVISERSVLEHLIYSACLENASVEQADEAFVVLEHHYIDWNEIRVSTASELAYTFPKLPDPQTAGERVRRTLQAVFETTYMFDLEELKKKNLSHAVEYLESLGVCSRFMIDYTVQNALGGHVIPLDENSLKVFRLLGLTQLNKTKTKEDVSGLERAISKNEGVKFASLLHEFAAKTTLGDGPEFQELRNTLKSLDAQVLKRDCTPPELVVIKPEKPEKPKPVPTPLAHAVPVLDDEIDAEDEHLEVRELEFIPNPITGEEFVAGSDELDDDADDDSPKAAKKEKPKKTAPKKAESPKPVPVKPAVADPPKKKTPPEKAVQPKAPKDKKEKKPEPPKKKAAEPKSPKSGKTETKKTVKKAPLKQKKGDASAKVKKSTTKAKNPPKPNLPKKVTGKDKADAKKSTTRSLRQKKPK